MTQSREVREMATILADLTARHSRAMGGEFGQALRTARSCADELWFCLVDRELPTPSRPAEAVLIALAGRALSTLYGVIDNLELSLSREAVVLHRSLFELMIQAWWLEQDLEVRADQYAKFDWLDRWFQTKNLGRWSEQDERLDDEGMQGLINVAVHYGVVEDTPEKRKAALTDLDAVAQALKREIFPGAGPGTWHGRRTVYQLVVDVGDDFLAGDRFQGGADYLEYLYRVVYGLASSHAHPSPRAVSEALTGRPGEAMRMEIGPNPHWTLPVISTAFPFALWTFQPLDRQCELNLEDHMSEAVERFHQAVNS